MTSPRQTHRARRTWIWAAVAAAVCVAVPVAAVVVDEPRSPGRHVAAQVSADDSTSASEPAAGPSPAAVPEPAVGAAVGAAERRKVRALFFGDSYFIGGGYTGEHNSMARLAARRLGWAAEINGGGGTGFVSTNWDYGLGNYLDQIAAGAFAVGPRRWVVIEGGNNDRGQPLDVVRTNARKVVRIAQRRFPDARVVLAGPLDNNADHADVKPIARTLRAVARTRGVPFVNMTRWLHGHYDLIGPDTIHPYPEGHRIMGRKLAKALRKLGA